MDSVLPIRRSERNGHDTLDLDDVRLLNCAKCDGVMLGPLWKEDYYRRLSEADKTRIVEALDVQSLRVVVVYGRPYCPTCYKKLRTPYPFKAVKDSKPAFRPR